MRKQYHTRTVGGDRLTWDVHRLVRLAKDLTPVDVALSDIKELDERWWFQTSDDPPTPRSIANHFGLMEQTDLQYPIILCAEGQLMDGMHRVLKALVTGRETVKAVQLDPTPPPDHINVDVAGLPYPDEEI